MAKANRPTAEHMLRILGQRKRGYVSLVAGSGANVPNLMSSLSAAASLDGLADWVADLNESQRTIIYMALQVGLITVAEGIVNGKQN